MKKAMSKILSAFLVAALVFTSAGVAFADSSDSSGKTEMKSSVVKATAASKAERLSIKKGEVKGTFIKQNNGKTRVAAQEKPIYPYPVVKTLITGNETIDGYFFEPADVADRPLLAISAPGKGTVMMEMDSHLSSGTFYLQMYSDTTCTKSLGIASVSNTKGAATMVANVPKAGTYYVEVSGYSMVGTVDVYSSFAYGTNATLSHKVWRVVGNKTAQTNDFKFKAPYTGYVKVYTQGYSGKIKLLNSKKSSLSNTLYGADYATFGVQKGKYYYIRAYSNGNYSDGAYRIKFSNGKITEKSGKKKSKAVTIAKKKTKKGTITAGSSQADYYKFKLTSKKTVKLIVKGATNDKIKIAVYKGSKKISGTPVTFYYSNKSKTLKSVGKWSKGTYYIKVYRGNKYSSGWYSLYWK